MNIALIIAGGSGERMRQDIPKQFINVFDKPVIVYTLEAFQGHPDIDRIAVVCLDGWQQILKAYAKQFNIAKLSLIVPNGSTGQESICNGIMGLKDICGDNDIVLVHDAIRPLVSKEIISDCIAKCQTHGVAISVIPCNEAILECAQTRDRSEKAIPRDSLMRTQTPQAFTYGIIRKAHEEANKRGIKNSVASCTLMIELGHSVFFSAGSEKNLKLTTVDDIEIFKALLKAEKSDWIK